MPPICASSLPDRRPVHVDRMTWRNGVLLAAIALLAVWLRLRHAAFAMVYDEMASMYFSSQPWGHLWGPWMVRETNPPLFYSLLKLWRGIVPMGHWWMRALPLGIAAVQLVVYVRFVRGRLGWPAAAAGLLLFAVSWSDIWQAAYLRGYGLAKLAVLVSFIGLLHAVERQGAASRRGWLVYGAGAVVAVYCHTTMLLWPVIATIAVLVEGLIEGRGRRHLAALVAANAAIAAASGWVLVITLVQLHGHAGNIDWLTPLDWNDYLGTVNLQLFTGGGISALLMAVMFVVGAWRGRRDRVVRLSVLVVVGTLALFRAAEAVHPIVSDFTLHWCFSFTALVAGAALPRVRAGDHAVARVLGHLGGAAVLGAVALSGLADLFCIEVIGEPQDWRKVVRTVADHPGAALLASHESMGVVIEQTCLVEFGRMPCPFGLVVMTDPRQTDTWAFGGYHGTLVAPAAVPGALRGAGTVYAFDRYYYMPVEHLGLDPRRWVRVLWDDGELIGPIPVGAFAPPGPGRPPRVPDYDAQYTGLP
jgi:hypothetical protein